MTDYKTAFPESFDNAEEISKLIDANNFDGEENILSIVGGWGTGKSKIKEILVNVSLKKKYNVIDFNAIEFEEKAQITSEIYNKISKSFLPFRFLPLNLCIWSKFHKFRAIAQLKKESNAQNLSTSLILGIVLVGIFTLFFSKLIEHISKSKYINDLLFNMPYFFHNDIENPILINKIIISIILIFLIIGTVDYLLKISSGIIPRKSHIDILEKITFNEKTILCIDEVDRISEESIRYLFNEINTIKSLKKKNLLILLFFDKHAILEISNNTTKQITINYLQKFYYNEYVIKRYTYIEKNKKQYLFIVWQFINSQILSFRDANRFEKYIDNYFIKLKKFFITNSDMMASVKGGMVMQLEKPHIRRSMALVNYKGEFASISGQNLELEAELIIDNIIRLILYLTFRYEINSLEILLKQLKQIESFREIVRIECYDMTNALFFPDNNNLNSKLNGASSLVMVVNNLWYGLIDLNLCGNSYFQLENSISDQLEYIAKTTTGISDKVERISRNK